MKIQLFNKTVSVIAVLLLVITKWLRPVLAAVAPEDELQSRSVPGAEKQVSEDVRPEVFSAVEVRQNFGTTQDFLCTICRFQRLNLSPKRLYQNRIWEPLWVKQMTNYVAEISRA